MISKNKKMDPFFCWCLLVCFFLQCPISFSWKFLSFLDIGSNLLEGPLPSYLCNFENLEFLLLSNNKLSGTIPHCFGNISSLTVLDLRKNGFHGMIPTTFPKDNGLRNLGLNGNQLEGPLPPSLINCKNLEVLDVGNNKITDEFPMWLETLPKLSVLILKSNRLHGTIGNSKSKSPFLKLRILDISYNQFTGFLPEELIKNFEAMKRIDNQTQVLYMGNTTYYEDSVTLMMKGLEIELKRVLTTLITIDLSGNQFEGVIPKSIGDLKSLKVLNVSHNKFHGLIPSILGDLSELESLDLSWNQLEGRIPEELRKLNFLSSFNISHNHIVGHIPQGGQFNTFSNSSFSGNKGLCGFPLKNCGEVEGTTQSPWIDHQTDYVGLMSGFTWQSVLLGYGFGMILGLSMGVLMFSIRKPKWLVTSIEDTCKRWKRPRNRDRSPLGWRKIN